MKWSHISPPGVRVKCGKSIASAITLPDHSAVYNVECGVSYEGCLYFIYASTLDDPGIEQSATQHPADQTTSTIWMVGIDINNLAAA